MTKAPEPGKVKTRLTPPLTPEESAALNKCFLCDLARAISTATIGHSGRGVGVYTPLGAEGAYTGILPGSFYLLPQRGSDFGQRLIFAVEDLLKVGFASVCLINSDSPTVPSASFSEAVRVLAEPGDREEDDVPHRRMALVSGVGEQVPHAGAGLRDVPAVDLVAPELVVGDRDAHRKQKNGERQHVPPQPARRGRVGVRRKTR